MSFVRQATSGDLPHIQTFDEWSTVTDEKIRTGSCYVAGNDERIEAFGIFDRSFFGRPFIAIVFVHPECRRQGLGSSLIQHFERMAKGKLWISTNIENLPMQRVLEKHRFQLCGVINDLGRVPELVYHKVVDAE